MSSTVFIPGKITPGNLTEPMSLSLLNFIKGNWPDSTALIKSTDIKFSTLWWDGYGSYQIHFLDRNIQRQPYVLGWNMDYAEDYVDMHIFVRKNSPTRPLELDDIKRSAESIIMPFRRNVPQISAGAACMKILRTVDAPINSFVHDLWHSVLQVYIQYYVATTS